MELIGIDEQTSIQVYRKWCLVEGYKFRKSLHYIVVENDYDGEPSPIKPQPE